MKNENLISFFSYVCVGAAATLVEWAAFFLFWHILHIHYIPSTALAFFFSTFANWAAGRLWTFRKEKNNIIRELILVYGASILGLLFNVLIMFFLVNQLRVNEMVSKMAATVIVFLYNYLVRKCVIYKKGITKPTKKGGLLK